MEDILPILVLLAWSILSAIGAAARKKKKAKEAAAGGGVPVADAGGEAAGRRSATETLLRELGVDLGPLASPPTPPAPPPLPRQPPPRRPAPPPLPVGGTPAFSMPETSLALSGRTLIEELSGTGLLPPEEEIELPFPPESLLPDPRLLGEKPPARPVGGLAGALLHDLHGGGRSLSRAFLLSEVLSPPVALRPPAEPR